MEIFPINQYNSQGKAGGGRAKNVGDNDQQKGQVKDSYEPSVNADKANALTPGETALVMEKIKSLPEIRANLLIYAKDQVVQGKYHEPEMVSPIAESLMA